MSKTTASMLTGSIPVVLVLLAGAAWAAPGSGPAELLIGVQAVGQAGPTEAPAVDPQLQAAELLRRARQLIDDNDLDGAELLITRAENLRVHYSPLHMGDTPQRARADLEKRRSAAERPARSGNVFSPNLFGRASAPSTDPFAGRLGGAGGADRPESGPAVDPRRVTPLPPVEPGSSVRPLPAERFPSEPAPLGRSFSSSLSPSGQRSPLPGASRPDAGPPRGPDKADSDRLLREARVALAERDLRRANGLVQQARNLKVQYDPLDDTPERVAAAIAQFEQVTSRRDGSESARRDYARMLMDQAAALMRWGELDKAEQLVEEAGRQQLSFGPLEANPQEMMRRIGEARRQAGSAGTAGAAPAGSPSAEVNLRAPGGSGVDPELHREARELVRQARQALSAGRLSEADDLARRAESLRLPDSAFDGDRPGLVLLDVRTARLQGMSGVVPAGNYQVVPATGPSAPDHTASRAVYDPANDPTRNVRASGQMPYGGMGPVPAQFTQEMPSAPTAAPPVPGTPAAPGASPAGPPAAPQETIGMSLFRQGEEAMKARQPDRALEFFRQAARYRDELDAMTAQRLQDHLQLLTPSAARQPAGADGSISDEAAAQQRLLLNQMVVEFAQQEKEAMAKLQSDPDGAIALLQEARKKVEDSGLEPQARARMLHRVDTALAEARQFIERNKPRLELKQRNAQVLEEVDRRQQARVDIDNQLAVMVDEFNRLMDEGRFEEAEVKAKRAAELDPQNPVIQQLIWQSKFVRRFARDNAIREEKEERYTEALVSVDKASIPFGDDMIPIRYAKDWADLVERRRKFAGDQARRLSPQELEIEQKLKTRVPVQFKNRPLSEVISDLSKLSDINIHLDPQGLAEEGVSADTPVTLDLRDEIMLKSALNLILEQLHLGYVIKDEVLKITSEQLRQGQLYTKTYNVADLVIPIPNFVPSPNMGLAGALHQAMGNVGFGGVSPFGATSAPLAVVAGKDGGGTGVINPAVLAQRSGPQAGPMPGVGGGALGAGPGGLAGGSQADFDSLIELITSTVDPLSWDDTGGLGSISPFETNLSIVVSQTQENHEQIADLLEQLRRLQDLQVTIEVRFITLRDSFFERIGVDFDFNIPDNIDMLVPNNGFGRILQPSANPGAGEPPVRDMVLRDVPADQTDSLTVGLTAPTTGPLPVFSADLDIPFRQNSFGLAVPQFGAFDATAGASLGFAILSDIEAFFFIEAAQGDSRSNVLQAPKVTLFNGQQAYVSDTSQSPFVISVIPVVGDFAAAQQPVIVVLSEGTFMTVQAVVSSDQRYVRLTIVPFFSRIEGVNTFTFQGTQTTTTDTSAEGWVNPADPEDNRRTNNGAQAAVTQSGTTVQLPTFSFITVTTTVSVPDGGTVLLGGIKRLSEDRREFGVPILNKLPYINRLFKNVGIGRETQSLMMAVTPRIIIQEEEEAVVLGVPPE